MTEKNVIYRSHTVIEANNLGYIVNLINNNGIHEGVENILFTPEMVAGCYAYEAALDADFGHSDAQHECHLDVLIDAGADFVYLDALQYAQDLAKPCALDEIK